ncbi:hypothetical protein [Flectobacillus longus]|uniref:hypothetical protein n=1 Tax=Flectobacillus longus TaxID=2984207 RepID=UPI0024B7BF6A|nr:hypothetical protein [Flectobacillus longus]MDI9878868.1 hypothetical protein [Flectobacillus longus]
METKQEIIEIVDRLPDNVLTEVLQILRQLQEDSQTKIQLSSNLSIVLKEDRELLKELAK